MSGSHLTREEIAKIELGKTDVSPYLARVMLALFLATAALPPIAQVGIYWLKRAPTADGTAVKTAGSSALALLPTRERLLHVRGIADVAALAPSPNQIRQFEDTFEDAALITRALTPWVGCVVKGFLHGGDEQVYFGRDGWLFYRSSVESVTGAGFLTEGWQNHRLRTGDKSLPPPQPDPVKALAHFQRQLSERGIALVVVPVPGKESVHPDKLTGQIDPGAILSNSSSEAFTARMVASGIFVFDPAPILAEFVRTTGVDAYLRTDTHWTPAAMQCVAEHLAGWLRERKLLDCSAADAGSSDAGADGAGAGALKPLRLLTQCRPTPPGPVTLPYLHTAPTIVTNTGDITAMLALPKGQRLYPDESVQITRVLTPEGAPWRPDECAEVLLMGDSFSNIYSMGEMGWGDSAGLAEHLSAALGTPLDRLVINAGGAYTGRQELARQITAGRDRLAGKRVVVYEFAARELAFGDWKLLELEGRAPSRTPAETTERFRSTAFDTRVSGEIAAIGRLPTPGSVPYKDCVVAIHLTNVQGLPSAAREGILVYALGFRDNAPLPVASLQTNQRVELRLREWKEVEDRYGSYNRAELDDVDLLFLPAYWADEAIGK